MIVKVVYIEKGKADRINEILAAEREFNRNEKPIKAMRKGYYV